MKKNLQKRIYVAGHPSLDGTSIVRMLARCDHVINARIHDGFARSNQARVRAFFSTEKIDDDYLAAAQPAS